MVGFWYSSIYIAVDPCGDLMQGISRLVSAMDLTSSVHYHVELVKFLIKEPNFIYVKILRFRTNKKSMN